MYGGMKLSITAATDTGRRHHNEDAFLIDEALGLVVVADGMGGYEGGEIASKLVATAVHELVARTARNDNLVWPCPADLTRTPDENELAMATYLANARVLAERRGKLAQMGATLAIARIRGHRATIAHVGDSRVYRIRDGRATALTRDHSLYEEMIRAGEHLPSRKEFAYGNVITRAVGTTSATAEVVEVELLPGDQLVVCTDGLWDPVPDELLAQICTALPPQQACEKLIALALERGGTDNITVAIATVSG
jgi:PPM family protein phosphatase